MPVMTAEEAAEAGKDLDFAKVWAALMETRLQMAELWAKTDARIAETDAQVKARIAETDAQIAKTDARIAETNARMAETDAQVKAQVAETTKAVKALSENIGGLNNTLGKLTEAMVSCNVWRKFEPLGYTFTTASQNRQFYENGKRLAEADYFLENGIFVMPIEVKTTLEIEDINKHLDRIERIRHCMDSRDDNRKIVGAMAAAVAPSKALEYAQEKGLYVLVQNGDSVDVADGGADFKAQEW
jgi:division protein CdvB (Snf7/Vps24/ESCRT-III family)